MAKSEVVPANQLATLYFVRDEILAEFLDEAKTTQVRVEKLADDLYFTAQPQRLFWVLDYWTVLPLPFTSISDAAHKLRGIAKRWIYAGNINFRRGQLIADALRIKPRGELAFTAEPSSQPDIPAAFTLVGKDLLYYTRVAHKGRYAGGKLEFVQDRIGPPSRAYLKLYEVLTLIDDFPSQQDHVLDLGATPGGWTYVVATLGAYVDMLDRSPPDQKLLQRFDKVHFFRGDGLNPPSGLMAGKDIILSDMACDPEKLLLAVQGWIAHSQVRLMICTLKFSGISDKRLIQKFAAIPGSRIYHLWHNGHELTWVWQRR